MINRNLPFLILLLLPFTLSAQLPLRHHIAPVKGEVLKSEQTIYKDVRLDAAGIPLLPKKSESRVVVTYENGLPVTQTHYDFFLDKREVLSSRTKFSYENGKVKTVKEFVNAGYSQDAKLKLHATFIHNYVNGVLESENVLDADGKMLATLKYLPEVQLGATPLIQFDEHRFEKGELQKRDRYGIQYDTSGRVQLHFQIRNGDTVFYREVTFSPPNTWRMEYFTASTRLIEEISWKSNIQYDAKGNELLMITENPEDTSATSYAVIVCRYQYAGDRDWSSEPIVGTAPEQVPPAPEKTPEIEKKMEEPVRVVAPPKEVPGHNQTPSNAAAKPAAPAPKKYFFPYSQFEENGKFGCNDPYKRMMIPAVYDDLIPYHANQGFILVKKDALWGLVDPENRPLLPLEYKHISVESKYIIVTDPAGKKGAVRPDGTFLFPCEYDLISWDFGVKVLKVKKDGLMSLYDAEGALLLPPKYANLLGSIHLPGFVIAQQDSLWGLVEISTGKVILPFEYQELFFSSSLMERKGEKVLTIQAKKNGAQGIIDQHNNIILPFEYQWAGLAADKVHILVRKNDRLGLLRQDGTVVIPIRYFQIYQPYNHIYMPLNEQDLWGVRTVEQEIVPEKYQRSDIEVSGKVIRVKDGDKFWLYSQTGAFEPFQYTHWEPLAEGMHAVLIYYRTDGRKCFVSNHDKDPVIEYFDQQTTREQGPGRKIIVLQRTDENGKTWYGIRQALYGNCIAPMIYSELDFNITRRHIDQFTRAKGDGSEYVCALGRKSSKDPWELIGSKGAVVRQ